MVSDEIDGRPFEPFNCVEQPLLESQQDSQRLKRDILGNLKFSPDTFPVLAAFSCLPHHNVPLRHHTTIARTFDRGPDPTYRTS